MGSIITVYSDFFVLRKMRSLNTNYFQKFSLLITSKISFIYLLTCFCIRLYYNYSFGFYNKFKKVFV